MNRNQIILANAGRKLMDISTNTSMKGLTDSQIGRLNRMAAFGDALTRYGALFGPRTLTEVLETSGVSMDEAKEFMSIAS